MPYSNGVFFQPKSDKYWIINQKTYDFSKFKHPGGQKVLFLARDRYEDCTRLFESQHLYLDKCKKIIEKYEVQTSGIDQKFKILDQPSHPTFMDENSSYNQLKRKVAKYLEEIKHPHGIPTKESIQLYYVLLFSYFFFLLLTYTSGSYVVSFVWGIVAAWMGAFGHNWIHMPAYRKYATFSLDLIGLSSENWLRSHVMQHHIYTNTPKDNHYKGTDPFLIADPERRRNWLQGNVLPLISPLLLSFGIYANHISNWMSIFRKEEALGVGNFFLLFTFLFFLTKYSFLTTVALLYTCHATVGMYYFTFALMNHNTVDALKTDYSSSTSDWIEHQLGTCVDWSTSSGFYKSMVYLWLNYHTVHHLFPKVDFSHHPAISKMLEEMYPEKYKTQKSPWSIYKEMIYCFMVPQRLTQKINK